MVLTEPSIKVVIIVLFCPKHAGECLAHDVSSIAVQVARNYGCIVAVCLLTPQTQQIVELLAERRLRMRVGDSHAHRALASRRYQQVVVRGHFGARAFGVDRLGTTVDDGIADAVLDVRGSVRLTEKALRVGLILGEEQRRGSVTEHV